MSERAGLQLWTLLGVLALGLLALLGGHVPALFDIIPQAKGNGLSRIALACAAAAALAMLFFPRARDPRLLPLCGALVFLWVAGPLHTGVLLLAVALWALFCGRVRPLRWRLLAFVALAAAGFHFRMGGLEAFGFWWVYVHYLKFLAIALYDNTKPLPLPLALSYFFSLPFLLGPFVVEWLTLDTYQRSLAFQPTRERARAGAGFVALGGLYLVLSSFAFTLQDFPGIPLLQKAVWNQKEGAGFEHLLAGAYIFLFMFWKRAGLTALGVGVFRLTGCDLPYDYHYFFLSKTHLEFCQRYHGNAKNFIARFVYLPVTMAAARVIGWKPATFVGIAVSLLFAGMVHFYAFIPVPGTPFSFHYPLVPTLYHRFWEGVFIFSTFFFFQGSQALARRAGLGSLGMAILQPVQIALAMACVSYLYFNTYAQCWMGWSNWEFFRSMFSW